jgi:hypothetical protein
VYGTGRETQAVRRNDGYYRAVSIHPHQFEVGSFSEGARVRYGQLPAIDSTLFTFNSGIVATLAAVGVPVAPVALTEAPAGAVGGITVPTTCTRLPSHDPIASPIKRYPVIVSAPEVPAAPGVPSVCC